jgi:peptidoglycan hydrolase-like protein with peptidoglycan-binding domain
MTQYNNNLSLHQQGKDVALLQSRLITLGHTIATSEILGELFGESTQQAVIQFQQAEGLPVTGRVDGPTAQAIVSSFEADKTVIKHTLLPIHAEATLVPPAISPTFFYALFRAGLPANVDILYRPDAQTLETVWTKAAKRSARRSLS